MTDYIVDDFSSIAQRLAELEADRNRASTAKPARAQRWACTNCNKYKREHEVAQRDGYKTKCLDCGAYVTLEK